MLTRKEQCALAFLCLTAQVTWWFHPSQGRLPGLGLGLGELLSQEDSSGLPHCSLQRHLLVVLDLEAHSGWAGGSRDSANTTEPLPAPYLCSLP